MQKNKFQQVWSQLTFTERAHVFGDVVYVTKYLSLINETYR